MILSYFNSYIEIFVALNLGYAAFDYFRSTLKNKIFKIETLSNRLNEVKGRLNVQIEGFDDTSDLKGHLINIREEVLIEEKQLLNDEDREQWFFEILKPLSFLFFLFCITYLIVAGFQENDQDLKFLYSDYIFRLSCFSSILGIIIYYSSFSSRVIKYKIKISIVQIIIAFFFFSTISCSWFYELVMDTFYYQIILLLLIPLILIIFFFYFNLNQVNKYNQINFRSLIKNFFFLILKNKLRVLKFLLLIINIAVGLIFSYLYFKLIVTFSFILVTPFLLFLLLTIRVFKHRNKYTKKYKKLASEQTEFMEKILKNSKP